VSGGQSQMSEDDRNGKWIIENTRHIIRKRNRKENNGK
jgi:hypothetical protein